MSLLHLAGDRFVALDQSGDGYVTSGEAPASLTVGFVRGDRLIQGTALMIQDAVMANDADWVEDVTKGEAYGTISPINRRIVRDEHGRITYQGSGLAQCGN